jgi:hypothetical protein
MGALSLLGTCIEVYYRDFAKLYEALTTEFARRYLPRLSALQRCVNPQAIVYWVGGEGFDMASEAYSSEGADIYVVRGAPPEPYTNESPVFFTLQVLARSLAKRGYVVLTDSVSLGLGSKNVLILGFPHTGKSTISALATSTGYPVYTTENTVVDVTGGRLRIVAGTRVLVYDPRVKELFGAKLEPTSRTKHGYEVVDLEKLSELPASGVVVDEVYVIYSSFTTTGFARNPVKGRKVEKLVWYFATSLLKGLDYYTPRPLDTPIDKPVRESLENLLKVFRENYVERFYEVFGSPVEILRNIAK